MPDTASLVTLLVLGALAIGLPIAAYVAVSRKRKRGVPGSATRKRKHR